MNSNFRKYTDNLAATLENKNKAYGDSFTKSVDKYGLSVIGVRLSDKYNRIEHLMKNARKSPYFNAGMDRAKLT